MCSVTIAFMYVVLCIVVQLISITILSKYIFPQNNHVIILYILCLYPTRINQNPDKATSVKLQQSGTKVAASDVLHGEAHGITQHSLASSSSPAVSQAYNEQADVYVWSVMMVYLF